MDDAPFVDGLQLVRDELEAFITCGDFEHGFLVALCHRCGDSLRVPFACKSRGICPSCMGRRMAETAALLVEHRLPEVPWRQWVLSLEGPMAVRLGYDRPLLRRVCPCFAKRVMQTLRQQSKREHALRSSSKLHPGVLIVVQRFRSDLGLFVHLHALVTDGCFEAPAVAGDAVAFMPAIGLGEQDLLRTLQRLHADLAEHLEVGGDDGEPVDEALVACVQLGLPPRAVGPSLCEPRPASPMLVPGFGMQLHAAVTVDGRDRKRLERVCRYLLRPAFALGAVQRTADGQVRVHFKKPNRFGATYAQMSADTFLARLCALVPPPQAHTVLYYGVLSAHHELRSAIVPRADEPEPPPKQLSLFIPRGQLEFPAITTLLHACLLLSGAHLQPVGLTHKTSDTPLAGDEAPRPRLSRRHLRLLALQRAHAPHSGRDHTAGYCRRAPRCSPAAASRSSRTTPAVVPASAYSPLIFPDLCVAPRSSRRACDLDSVRPPSPVAARFPLK